GGGAEAGAVRYITNKPKLNVFEGRLDASYGLQEHGDSSTSITGVLNIGIIPDRLAARIVIYNHRQGGYINNVPSLFTRSNEDNNVYFNIKPTAGVCPNGKPPGRQNGLCTPLGLQPENNFALAKKAWNPVTHEGGRFEVLYSVNEDWDVLIAESLQQLD